MIRPYSTIWAQLLQRQQEIQSSCCWYARLLLQDFSMLRSVGAMYRFADAMLCKKGIERTAWFLRSCSCVQCAWIIPASKSCNGMELHCKLYEAMHRKKQRASIFAGQILMHCPYHWARFKGYGIGQMPDREGAFAGLSHRVHIRLQRLLWQYVSFKLGDFPQYTWSICRAVLFTLSW